MRPHTFAPSSQKQRRPLKVGTTRTHTYARTHTRTRTLAELHRRTKQLRAVFCPLRRHNQQPLEATKDPEHKNRCRVLFPEVFSTFPYKVNVTAINALGTAHATVSFEESAIGELDLLPGSPRRRTRELSRPHGNPRTSLSLGPCWGFE